MSRLVSITARTPEATKLNDVQKIFNEPEENAGHKIVLQIGYQ